MQTLTIYKRVKWHEKMQGGKRIPVPYIEMTHEDDCKPHEMALQLLRHVLAEHPANAKNVTRLSVTTAKGQDMDYIVYRNGFIGLDRAGITNYYHPDGRVMKREEMEKEFARWRAADRRLAEQKEEERWAMLRERMSDPETCRKVVNILLMRQEECPRGRRSSTGDVLIEEALKVLDSNRRCEAHAKVFDKRVSVLIVAANECPVCNP